MSLGATGAGPLPPRRAHWADAISALLYRRHGLWLAALLLPPLLWFGIIYLGSLLSLLAHSFFRLDDYSGLIVYEIGLSNFIEIFTPANLDVAFRTTLMAARPLGIERGVMAAAKKGRELGDQLAGSGSKANA